MGLPEDPSRFRSTADFDELEGIRTQNRYASKVDPTEVGIGNARIAHELGAPGDRHVAAAVGQVGERPPARVVDDSSRYHERLGIGGIPHHVEVSQPGRHGLELDPAGGERRSRRPLRSPPRRPISRPRPRTTSRASSGACICSRSTPACSDSPPPGPAAREWQYRPMQPRERPQLALGAAAGECRRMPRVARSVRSSATSARSPASTNAAPGRWRVGA